MIVFFFLPYYAKNNDALITKHILKINTDEMKSWLNDDDIFGCRDVSGYLIEEGYDVTMPQDSERQQSAEHRRG